MTPAERAAQRQGAHIPLDAYTADELVAELRQVSPAAQRLSEIIAYAVHAGRMLG